MKMINKLERKFGRYAIKNLSLYLILGYVIGYLLLMFAPQVLSKLILVPAFVMQGEVWRLLTWVITPPANNTFFRFGSSAYWNIL